MKNAEQNFTVSRAMEMYRESEYAVTVTDFLSPGEKIEVYNELIARVGNGISRCFFWGGCRGTERCAAVFLPEWYGTEDAPGHKMVLDEDRTSFFASYLDEHSEIVSDIGITAVQIRGSGYQPLSHRDYMGGLLSLGIERRVVGDISVVSDNEAIVFVLDKIAPYICTELTRIGRDKVTAEVRQIPATFEITRKYDMFPIVVSSPRIDGIVKAITGKSREIAAEMVRGGLVELSYSQVTSVSDAVKEGDILSIRGYGKYVIGEQTGNTKSGRIRMMCKKYL